MSQLESMQDAGLPGWRPGLTVHGGPRFLQIADALLAAQPDVGLTTLTRAYDEARRSGWL